MNFMDCSVISKGIYRATTASRQGANSERRHLIPNKGGQTAEAEWLEKISIAHVI